MQIIRAPRTGGRLTGRPVRVYGGTGPRNSRRKPPLVMVPSGPRGGGPLVPYHPRTPRYQPTRPYRRRPSASKAMPIGVGSSRTTFREGRNFMPRYMYNLFKQNQDWISTSITSAKLDFNTYGSQQLDSFCIYTSSNFNDDLTLAGGVAPTIGALTTSELFYAKSTLRTTFTNVELTTSYVTIYEISPRFHQLTASSNTPKSTWKDGLVAEYGGASLNFHTMVYNKPFDSSLFTHFYKVKKTYSFALAAGESHDHEATYNHNRAVHGCVAYSHEIFAPMSKYQLIVVSGTPINDSVNNTLVSTSTTSLNVVRRLTRKFTYAPQLRTRYMYADALNTITSANVISQAIKQADAEA